MREALAILALVLFASPACPPHQAPLDEPLFRFGLVADVQYADKDRAGARRYRESLDNLRDCLALLAEEELEFVAQLGDLIDGRDGAEGSREDLAAVLAVMDGIEAPWLHVVGNHCFSVPRGELLEELGLQAAHHASARHGWRFVALDTLDVSTCGRAKGSEQYDDAMRWLLQHLGALHANPWNGGVSEEQLDWLRAELAAAEEAQERVVVLGHLPLLAEAASPQHLLWEHASVREVLRQSPAVVAYLAGHDHGGGYAVDEGGVHHLTLPGMVEAPREENAWAIVEVYPQRLEVRGHGRVASRTLRRDP